MTTALNGRMGFVLSGLLVASGCGPSLTPAQHYGRAVQHRLDGHTKAYLDALIELAHQEPSSRAGRRARATLRGADPLLQLAMAVAAGALTRQVTARLRAASLQRQARVALRTLAGALQTHYAATGRYCLTFAECQVTPAQDSPFVYYLSRDEVAGAEQHHEVTSLRRRAITLADALGVVPRVGNEAFTLVAVGNLDRDDALDVWLVDQRGNLVHVLDDRMQ